MEWTFLTNYAHVLVCLARDPTQRLRDVADSIGITERAVQRIIQDLQHEGYIEVTKTGRRNSYQLIVEKKLRHPLEKQASIHDLIAIAGDE